MCNFFIRKVHGLTYEREAVIIWLAGFFCFRNGEMYERII